MIALRKKRIFMKKHLVFALGLLALSACSSVPSHLPSPNSFTGEAMSGPFIAWESDSAQPQSWIERNEFWEAHTRSVMVMQVTTDQGVSKRVMVVRGNDQDIILVSHNDVLNKKKYTQSWVGDKKTKHAQQFYYDELTQKITHPKALSERKFLHEVFGFEKLDINTLWQIVTPNTSHAKAWRMTDKNELLSQRQANWQANYAEWNEPNEGPKSPASIVLGQKGKIWSISMTRLLAYRANESEKDFPYTTCLSDLIANPNKIASQENNSCGLWGKAQ